MNNLTHRKARIADLPRLVELLLEDELGASRESKSAVVHENYIKAFHKAAKDKGATQIVVVCGAHDHPKRKFLSEQNLQVASEWFVGGIV